MSKTCASCGKSVYPVEQLKCMDQIWHKACFKCTVCGMTLNLKNYRAADKKPYCNAHYPQPKSYTVITDSQEIIRARQIAAFISQVSYTGKRAAADATAEHPAQVEVPDVVNRRKSETPPPPPLGVQQQLQQQQQQRPGSIDDFDPERHNTVDRRLDPHAGRRGSTIFSSSAGMPSAALQLPRSESRTEPVLNSAIVESAETPKTQLDQRSSELAQVQPEPEKSKADGQVGVPKPKDPIQDEVPKPLQEEVPKPLQEEVPKKLHEEVPKPPQEEVPKPLQEEVPKPLQEEVPKPLQEEVPKKLQEEVPKPIQEDVPKPIQEDVPKPIQEDVPKAQHHAQDEALKFHGIVQEANSETAQACQASASTAAAPPTPVTVSKPALPQGRNRGRCFRAQFSYTAQDTDEVTFSEGDLITHGDPIDAGWMYGILERTGQYGMMPFNYMEEVVLP